MLRIFAGRFDPVMATGAAGCNAIMREIGGKPVGRRVAGVALIHCCNMLRALSGSFDPIMTTGASTVDRIMIDLGGRAPAEWRMTQRTVITGCKMLGCFSSRLHPVVTTETGFGHAIMIEAGGIPVKGAVASVTLAAGDDMLRRFALGQRSIMATGACARHRCVIDPGGGRPLAGRVA